MKTTDDEFEAALHNMGVRRTKRTVAYMQYSSGEEVDQVVVEASSGGVRGGENTRPGRDGLGPEVSKSQQTSASAHNSQAHQPPVRSEKTLVASDSQSAGNKNSDYKGSADSAHIRGNISDEEAVEDIYDGAPTYDPDCDNRHLQFNLRMRSKSPTQLKFAVTKNAIYYGANLYWLRTGARRCEAVCAQKECKWSIYAAWYRVNKCFMVRRIGQLHNCARNVVVKQATANFLATDFLEDFRNNRGWEVEEIVAAIRRRYGIEVSEWKCYRARKK
ncbi:hypothetical protein LINGRAHAP2_LOCUS24109 [Linum grandiflorum]